MKVFSLALDFQVGLRRATGEKATAMAALFASAQAALLVVQAHIETAALFSVWVQAILIRSHIPNNIRVGTACQTDVR
jgi:hypothetical protein